MLFCGMTQYETWRSGSTRSADPEYQLFLPPDPGAAPRILYTGWQRCDGGHAHSGCRPHGLLHWVVSGSGRVRVGSRWRIVGPGQGFFFRASERFAYQADDAEPWAYVWAGIGGQEAEDWLEQAGMGRAGPLLSGMAGAEAFFLRWFSQAEDAVGRLPALLRLGRRGALELMDLLEDAAAAAGWLPAAPPPPEGHAARIRQFLEENYSRKLSTGIVARALHLDRSHCCTLFQRAYGVGMMGWLGEYRLRRAAELLGDRKLRIGDVASSVGIGNEAHFSRAFAAAYGLSPGRWRQANTRGA